MLRERIADAPEGESNFVCRAQVKLDAADLALVSDLGRQYFEHHRKAHAGCDQRGIVGAGGMLRNRGGDSDRFEDLFGFDFGQRRASGSGRLGNYLIGSAWVHIRGV